MAVRLMLVVGTAPDCDLVLQGPGIAPRHAEIGWRDGLVVHDLGQGVTTVDGRVLQAHEASPVPTFQTQVALGQTPLPLHHPVIASLFVDRSPMNTEAAFVVGRDPMRAHVLVQHPTVSGAHARLDPVTRTITDLGSRSGTFDRNGQRLAPQQPTPLDFEAGYFFGLAWVSTSALVHISQQPPPSASTSISAASSLTSYPSHVGVNPLAQTTPAVPSPVPAPTAPKPTPPVASNVVANRPRTFFGSINLQDAGIRQAIIGRLPSCDIVIPYAQLSGRHASIMRGSDGSLLITDLGSTNGTYIGGQRIPPNQAIRINPGDRIFVGPYPLVVDVEGDAIRAYVDHERSEWTGNLVEIEALDLLVQVPDREHRDRQRVLLDHITFKARPGDQIALMGPSGAGKTTLLTVLNGYLRPSSGEVRVNGENLYAVYDALRGNIGYVPQDDIVHPELTVWEAIKYSAQFRLPPDYSEEEIDRRVEQTVRDLGLEQVKHLEIGRPERKILSGGQRKRVNIAIELVTDPALMFLDEPTSGLAADDTVALIDLLSNLAKKTGKTIIVTIHQPAREEYEKFNLALIMGYGGVPVYYGPSGRESYEFFGRYGGARSEPIDNPRDMFDLLRQREDEFIATRQFADRPAARLAASQAWRAEYYRTENPTYRKMYSGSRQPGTAGGNRPARRATVPWVRQFRLLLERYAIVKQRDRVGITIMLAQAPIIGVLLAMVFAHPARSPNMWCRFYVERLELAARRAGTMLDPACLQNVARFPDVSDFAGAIFFLSVAAIWFGTSNAGREIVAEQAIYRRERMVNLSIVNYVLSKFTMLSALSVIQCTVLLGILYPVIGLGNGSWNAFAPMLAMMIITAMCAVAIGLLLSTVVVSTEAAMALTPIVLIPQVVLGGRLVPMSTKAWLRPVMSIIPARWSFEGVLGAERAAVADPWRVRACVASGRGISNGWFQCALEEVRNHERGAGGMGFITFDRPLVAAGVLITMSVIVLALVMILLRRRDSI